ncbi:MAG: pilus assembly protein PilM [[Actinobacillus] rossii]|uniref:Competence protein A n=1 Tax=[Actinobacillus] rossii TaxID=123820 RepID=A0A380TM49_9PAST|nr:pilus assembly protein PilM [[Actinobacillus] rossii]MDY4506509.1 pilus assembly protein PilM [[Actinobacillus] rossii]SUT87248.1 competence protein A [[Actinobacillus] rossii]
MKKIKSIVPIGLWVHKNQVEAVWLEKPQWARNKTTINPPPEPHFATIPLMPQVTLANRIIREMTIYLKPHKTDLLFISGVLPNNVWERSLIIPQKLSEQECQQQCEYLLAKELPIPLENVWFDYHATTLKQGTLLQMNAVLIEKAQEHMKQFAPLKIRVLDSVSHALDRAFNYLEPDLPKETLYLYADDNYAIAFQEKGIDFNVLQTSDTNLTALYEQFCERYKVEPEIVCTYLRDKNLEQSREFEKRQWKQCNTDLPMIALGLALWHLSFS